MIDDRSLRLADTLARDLDLLLFELERNQQAQASASADTHRILQQLERLRDKAQELTDQLNASH